MQAETCIPSNSPKAKPTPAAALDAYRSAAARIDETARGLAIAAQMLYDRADLASKCRMPVLAKRCRAASAVCTRTVDRLHTLARDTRRAAMFMAESER